MIFQYIGFEFGLMVLVNFVVLLNLVAFVVFMVLMILVVSVI